MKVKVLVRKSRSVLVSWSEKQRGIPDQNKMLEDHKCKLDVKITKYHTQRLMIQPLTAMVPLCPRSAAHNLPDGVIFSIIVNIKWSSDVKIRGASIWEVTLPKILLIRMCLYLCSSNLVRHWLWVRASLLASQTLKASPLICITGIHSKHA